MQAILHFAHKAPCVCSLCTPSDGGRLLSPCPRPAPPPARSGGERSSISASGAPLKRVIPLLSSPVATIRSAVNGTELNLCSFSAHVQTGQDSGPSGQSAAASTERRAREREFILDSRTSGRWQRWCSAGKRARSRSWRWTTRPRPSLPLGECCVRVLNPKP